MCQHFQTFFRSETTGPIEAKFHVQQPWDGETKVCSNGPGHITKMAAMSIYNKNLQKFLRNQKAYDLETWYVASGARVLVLYYQVCSNDDPGLTLNYVMARSDLVPYAFVWRKKVKQGIFQKLL